MHQMRSPISNFFSGANHGEAQMINMFLNFNILINIPKYGVEISLNGLKMFANIQKINIFVLKC